MGRLLHPTKAKYLALEVLALLVILAAFNLVLHHINTSMWKDFVFNNSDILTLPLVWQSIILHEPFHWVFSSQIFLFPEAVLYCLSALFSGGNFKIAVVINAFISILLLYILIRVLLRFIVKNKTYNIALSLLYILGILTFMAAGRRSDSNIAMFFFVTTSYYGVILSGLLSLILAMSLIKIGIPRKNIWRGKGIYILLAYVLVSFLTGLSNTLFFLQFSAPLLVVLVLTWLLKRFSPRMLAWFIGGTILAVGASVVLRGTLLNQYFSPLGGISNYIHVRAIGTTIKTFFQIFRQMLEGGIKQEVEAIVLIFLVVGVICIFIYHLWTLTKRRPTDALALPQFILIAFAAIAPIASIAGAIITGNPVMRYLLPVLFFSPLGFIPILSTWLICHRRIFLISLGVVIIAVFTVSGVRAGNPLANYSAAVDYYPSAAVCLDTKLANTPYKNGVAQYWRARDLQLNSTQDHRVVQVGAALQRFGWLYNNSDYNLYDLSFVVVDIPSAITSTEISKLPSFTIEPSTVIGLLGQPDNIYTCGDFYVYGYSAHNPGRILLNQRVRDLSLGI